MSIDYPRAWQIARSVEFDKHDPCCSYVIAQGGFLCDCDVVYAHPEYLSQTFYGKDGEVIRNEH